MELKILELSASHAFGIEGIKKTDSYTSVIDQYKLDSTDLSEYNVLLITYLLTKSTYTKTKT